MSVSVSRASTSSVGSNNVRTRCRVQSVTFGFGGQPDSTGTSNLHETKRDGPPLRFIRTEPHADPISQAAVSGAKNNRLLGSPARRNHARIMERPHIKAQAAFADPLERRTPQSQ